MTTDDKDFIEYLMDEYCLKLKQDLLQELSAIRARLDDIELKISGFIG